MKVFLYLFCVNDNNRSTCFPQPIECDIENIDDFVICNANYHLMNLKCILLNNNVSEVISKEMERNRDLMLFLVQSIKENKKVYAITNRVGREE